MTGPIGEFTSWDLGLQPPAILASLPYFPYPHVSSAIRTGMRKSCHQCKRIWSDSNTLQGGQEGVPRCFFLHREGDRSGRRWSSLWGSSKSRSTRNFCQFSKCFGKGGWHDDWREDSSGRRCIFTTSRNDHPNDIEEVQTDLMATPGLPFPEEGWQGWWQGELHQRLCRDLSCSLLLAKPVSVAAPLCPSPG